MDNTQDEYEKRCANTLENFTEIAKWVMDGTALVPYHDGPNENYRGTGAIILGNLYARKNPSFKPKKMVKKMVDLTKEELTLMIGKYIFTEDNKYVYIVGSNVFHYQDKIRIAPIGTTDWRPMQKEIEVEE